MAALPPPGADPFARSALGFVDLPPLPPSVLDDGRDPAAAVLSGGAARRERSLAFQLSWTADDDWYCAPASPAADARFAEVVRLTAQSAWLDVAVDWRADLRIIRTLLRPAGGVPAAPIRARGPAFLAFAVLRRDALDGGVTRVRPAGAPEPAWDGVLRPGRALLASGEAELVHETGTARPGGTAGTAATAGTAPTADGEAGIDESPTEPVEDVLLIGLSPCEPVRPERPAPRLRPLRVPTLRGE